jgi:hypothetical protein
LNSTTPSFRLPSSRAKPSSSSTLTMIIHQLVLSFLFPFASQPGQVACADAWLGDTGPRCVFLLAIFPFLESLFEMPFSYVCFRRGCTSRWDGLWELSGGDLAQQCGEVHPAGRLYSVSPSK